MADSGARQAKASRAVNNLIQSLTATYQPGDLLPSIQGIMDEFSAGQNIVRTALQRMREDGVIVTENGIGSRMSAVAPAHVLTRTAADPFAHLHPTAPAEAGRSEAGHVLSDLFALRKGALLFTLRQAAEYSCTRTPAHTLRIIPADSLFDLEPRPDPHGDRAKIIEAFTNHYGPLHTCQRTRTIPAPTPDIRGELKIKPGITVDATAIATRTARSGRLLMTETEYTIADPTIEWETHLN